jgi:3-hydroxyisobutyrate dehydrogenase
MLRVGFVGLGIMGQPMAVNVLEAGFPLAVFNRTKSKCHALAALGATVARSPRELAEQSDVVIVMVSDTPDVEQVLFSEAGVWRGVRQGMTVIDMSTISPRATVQFSDRFFEKGCEMLDAPVSGGEKGAREKALGIMVGGKREVFDKFLPLLQAMGKTIIYAGPSGSGQKTKLVNQVVGAINLLATVEGMRLVRATGLDAEVTLRAISSGAASSWMLTNLGPKILNNDFAPGFSIRLQDKDLKLATELIADVKGEYPGTRLVSALFAEALRCGLGDLGNHSLINLWREAGYQETAMESGKV